jgi:hypothetical protein
MQRHVPWAALSALLALIAPAAHAAPLFTPIVQVWCEFEDVCVPEVPVTQMIETAPGQFVYVGEYGVMYTLMSSGTYTQGYILNDSNTMNSTPLQASDGNIYVPTSLGAGNGGSMVAEFNSKLKWLQNIGTPAFPYAAPLVEMPDQLLWGTSIPAHYDAARFTLTLGGTATPPAELPSTWKSRSRGARRWATSSSRRRTAPRPVRSSSSSFELKSIRGTNIRYWSRTALRCACRHVMPAASLLGCQGIGP